MKTDRVEIENVLIYCPFLGLADDPETSLSFPSVWNNCHHGKKTEPVTLEHQRKYCLSENHPFCPVFNQPAGQPFPRELRYARESNSGRRRLWNFLLFMLLIVVVVRIGLASFQILPIKNPFPINNLIPLSTNSPIPVQASPSPTSTPTSTAVLPSATPFVSPVPSETVYISETPFFASTRIPHQIESLVGLNYLFRIHRIKNSDTLASLAYQNNTTEAAIVTINYSLPTPLRTQTLVVIPVNRKDVSDLPKFEAYRVLEDTDIEVLAGELDVNPEELQLYNGLGTETQLYAGEWLVVPR